MVPVSTSANRFTNVYFYPIISPSTIEIDVEIYDVDGMLLGKVPKAQRIVSPHTELHHIHLKALCHQLGIPGSQTLCARSLPDRSTAVVCRRGSTRAGPGTGRYEVTL